MTPELASAVRIILRYALAALVSYGAIKSDLAEALTPIVFVIFVELWSHLDKKAVKAEVATLKTEVAAAKEETQTLKKTQ